MVLHFGESFPTVSQFLRCKNREIWKIMGCRIRYSCRSLFKTN